MRAMSSTTPLLSVRGLAKEFSARGGLFSGGTATVRAVDGVEFDIGRGETLSLVGESGCGKSTTGRMIARLIEPTAGSVVFDGDDVTVAGGKALRLLRRDIQMIFQDPYSSLNPRKTVGEIVAAPLRIQGIQPPEGIERRVRDLLGKVGLDGSSYGRYPSEFSGGQRQRIGIARALVLQPKLIVCDEPVSALDVSVQAQVINLLEELQESFGLSYLFIAHDLAVVRHISDRVAVMYLGRIAEIGDADTLYSTPRHPYTNALLSAVPVPNPARAGQRRRIVLKGELPRSDTITIGCPFHTRCPAAGSGCDTISPPLKDVGAGQKVACHYPIS